MASTRGEEMSFRQAAPTSLTIFSFNFSSVIPFSFRAENSTEGSRATPSPPWTMYSPVVGLADRQTMLGSKPAARRAARQG